MKKKILIEVLLLTIGLMLKSLSFAQTNYFKHDLTNMYSYITDVVEYNGYYYFVGNVSNNVAIAENRYYSPIIYKMDYSGNILNTMINNTDSSNYCFPKVYFNGDTILMFNGYYDEQIQKSYIDFYMYDLNFSFIQKKSYQFNDPYRYTIIKVIKDKYNDILVSGAKSSVTGWLTGSFLVKFTLQGDTIKTNMNFNSDIPYVIDIPSIDKYYCCVVNNYLDVINRDLIKENQISVMDTFFSFYYSGQLIGYDSLFIMGFRIMTQLEPDFDNRRNIIFKTIDFQGTTQNFYEINTPDTISYPALEGVSYNGQDVFCSWIYNEEYINKPSKIGVGKFNKSLQPQWIKHYGKANTKYDAVKTLSTSDGGCLIVGGYRKTSFVNDDWRYFILKVNSAGLATFMKHTDIKVQNTINIYPNPAVDEVAITLINQMQSIKEIAVFDIQGKEVLNKQSNSAEIKLDVSSLSSGVYLIKGKTNTGLSFGRKFVKE